MRWPFGHARRDRQVQSALPAALAVRLPAIGASVRQRRQSLASHPLATARLVVLDLETSGLRADRDRLLAVAAVAVRARSLHYQERYVRTLRQDSVSGDDNILVHGIGAGAQRAGDDPAEALAGLAEFAGSAPWFAFRADFDGLVLQRHFASLLGLRVQPCVIDLAAVLAGLMPGTRARTFDDWLAALGVPQARRHDALSDAGAAAALLLVAIDRALQLGLHHCGDLVAIERAQGWLGR